MLEKRALAYLTKLSSGSLLGSREMLNVHARDSGYCLDSTPVITSKVEEATTDTRRRVRQAPV